MDWLYLLAVQGTLKSLLQHHSSKASILWHSTIFYSPTHIHTWLLKTIALTRWTFVGRVMFLLLNMLFKLDIAFLPKSKCLLISWLQSPSAVIWGPPKIKSLTVSIVSSSICHEVMGPDAMIFILYCFREPIPCLHLFPLNLSRKTVYFVEFLVLLPSHAFWRQTCQGWELWLINQSFCQSQ